MSLLSIFYSLIIYLKTFFASVFQQEVTTATNNQETVKAPPSPAQEVSISTRIDTQVAVSNKKQPTPPPTPRTLFRKTYDVPVSSKTVLPPSSNQNNFKETLAVFYEQNASLQVRDEGASYFTLDWHQEPDNHHNLVFNEAALEPVQDIHAFQAPYKTVKSATPNKLIEQLVSKQLTGESYTDLIEVFFATYTSFLSPEHLLERLGSLTVLNVNNQQELQSLETLFTYWLENYFFDLSNDTICRLIKFLTTLENLSVTATTFVEKIREIVHTKIFKVDNYKAPTSFPLALDWEVRKQEAEDRLAKEAEEGGEDTEEVQEEEPQEEQAVDEDQPAEEEQRPNEEEEEAPQEEEENLEPQYPENWNETQSFELLSWPTIEIARQLSIMELQLLKHIQPSELLCNNYTASNMDKRALNVAVMIHRFNLLSKWATRTILEQSDKEKRAATIVYMLDLVSSLVGMGNFNASMAIYGSLNQQPVFRLKDTWAAVDQEHTEIFEALNTLFSPNKKFKNMKDALDLQQPPSVPYIGMFLGDLSTVDSVTKDHAGSLINFNKKRVCTKIIRHLQMFQKYSYKFTAIPYLQNYFKNEICKNIWSDDLEFQTSSALEPKNK